MTTITTYRAEPTGPAEDIEEVEVEVDWTVREWTVRYLAEAQHKSVDRYDLCSGDPDEGDPALDAFIARLLRDGFTEGN